MTDLVASLRLQNSDCVASCAAGIMVVGEGGRTLVVVLVVVERGTETNVELGVRVSSDFLTRRRRFLVRGAHKDCFHIQF
jgi:hypothetical protein